MTSLTIKLSDEARRRLDEKARLEGKSVSALVRECLAHSGVLDEPAAHARSLFDRAGDLCGCFDSGVTDLATNPKHLEDFGKWRS